MTSQYSYLLFLLIQYGLFTCWKFRFVFHLWLQAVYLSFSTLCPNTVESPVSDHPKCKGLVVAYESRTARAKFLSQTRIEWYTYSKKIMKVYFPLPITGSFIDKIVCYSMWDFIYGSALTMRFRNVPKTSEEQKLNFLNWNLEIWVFFSRIMINIVVIDRTNNTL